jgi:hypothetical protein
MRCIYGTFGREVTKFTVIYVYIYGSGQLHKHILMVLDNPRHQ